MREHGGRPAEDAKTRLLYAVCTGDEASARQLLAEGAAFSEEDHHLLVDAAEAGNVEGVRLMLKLGFPQDTRRTSYGGWDGPALHYAAWHGHAEIVQLLIDAGADVRATNCFGSDALGTALHGLQHAGHSRGDEAADVIRKALQRLGDNRNR